MKLFTAQLNSNKGSAHLFLILLLSLGLFILTSIWSLSKQKTNDLLPFPNSSHAQKANTNNRIVYDFTKILSENFLTLRNEQLGLSIRYPKEAIIYHADQKVNISLVSQTTEGTELFDGLSIHLFYSENLDRSTLEQIVPQKTKSDYSEEGVVSLREHVTINNSPSLKIFTCCWGGGTLSYYFLSKNNKYIVQINIFSVGPDKTKFDQIADRIIQSFQYTP